MAGYPRKFEDLHAGWAAAGYAVAAPVFPLSNDGTPGAFGNGHDVVNQPGDVSFVLDELLARSADGESDLAGRFDPDRLAASGLSAGGFTTYEVAVNEGARDPRLRAAVVMSGAFDPDSTFVGAEGVPVLVLHGDTDPLITVAEAKAAYDALEAPRYFVVLLGGGHAGPFEDEGEGFEPKVPGHDELILASTVAFWDHYLLHVDEAGAELLTAAASDGLTTLEVDLG
jgi:predicted dienelactone hydrolase